LTANKDNTSLKETEQGRNNQFWRLIEKPDINTVDPLSRPQTPESNDKDGSISSQYLILSAIDKRHLRIERIFVTIIRREEDAAMRL
jgi:hypothetical protein